MKHLHEQTGVITKEELREMLQTNNADQFFEVKEIKVKKINGYPTNPKAEYYLEGPGLLQVFSLDSEDGTRCIDITVYGNINNNTGHIEPAVYFEIYQAAGDDYEFIKGMKCEKAIDYNSETWWEDLEDHMRNLLK